MANAVETSRLLNGNIVLGTVSRTWNDGAKAASQDGPTWPLVLVREALQAGGMSLPFPHLPLHIGGAKGLEAFVPAEFERPAPPQREEH